MFNLNVNANFHCAHTSHLFSHPLCEGQSVLKRITNVAFHVLTLGIPLAIYHIWSCCYDKRASESEGKNLRTTAINSVGQVNRNTSNSALKQAENDMKEEIASKIKERYQGILNLISNPDNPLCQILVDRQLQSLALEINTIWTDHNLSSLEKSRVSIDREKIHEVLDVFVKQFPLLQQVKDLIASV